MQYDEAKEIIELIKGQRTVDAFLQNFRDFFREEFNLELITFFCKGDSCKKVEFVLWDRQDVELFYISTNAYFGLNLPKIELIKNEFSYLCKRFNVHVDYFDARNYIVIPKCFNEELTKIVLQKTKENIDDYLASYPTVKKVCYFETAVYIFYETDNDIILSAENGLSKTIEKNICDLIRNADEFNIIEKVYVTFTSIQTLNEKFQGNTYLYLL